MDVQQEASQMTGEDDFEVVMRGYNRRQVDDFVTRTRSELSDLEQRLSVARRETERARKELAATRSELESARDTTKPAHAAVSERLSQILRLAAEEADQERAAAEAAIAEMKADAANQVQRMREDTAAECERLLNTAREQSERDLAAAREEAARMLGASKDEADHTVTSAKEHAHRVVSAAERRAVAVTDVANRRLAALTARHTHTVERLSEIREVLVGVLSDEAAAGPLEDEVQRLAGMPGPDPEGARVEDIDAIEAEAVAQAGLAESPAGRAVDASDSADEDEGDDEDDEDTGEIEVVALPESQRLQPGAPADRVDPAADVLETGDRPAANGALRRN